MDGRNSPCSCGSGKKYKRCCLDKDSGPKSPWMIPVAVAAASLLLMVALQAMFLGS